MVLPSKIETLLLKSHHIGDVCVVGIANEPVIELSTVIVVSADNSNRL